MIICKVSYVASFLSCLINLIIDWNYLWNDISRYVLKIIVNSWIWVVSVHCKKFSLILKQIDWNFPMNYVKYDTICCKRCFYLLICNELSCIDQGNQLLILTNTMNITTIVQPSNSMYFCMGTFYSVETP